jgi:hypothetical protein
MLATVMVLVVLTKYRYGLLLPLDTLIVSRTKTINCGDAARNRNSPPRFFINVFHELCFARLRCAVKTR